MIQALIVKAIFNAIYKAIQKKHNLKKMEDYVNKPNELDKQMKQVQKNLNKALKYIEVLEKDVGTLKANSHPPIKGLERKLKKIEKKIRSI